MQIIKEPHFANHLEGRHTCTPKQVQTKVDGSLTKRSTRALENRENAALHSKNVAF